MKYRTGAPSTPDTTTAGVEGASAMEVEFRKNASTPSYARPCIINNINADSEVIYVKVNETGATATDYHYRLAAYATQDLSLTGQVAVATVSIYAGANSPYDTLKIFGWEP